MSSLTVRCIACKTLISRWAWNCPQCGHLHAKLQEKALTAIGWTLVFAGILMFLAGWATPGLSAIALGGLALLVGASF